MAYLAGDEWIVLDGLHPALPRFTSRLPSIRGAAIVYRFSGGAFGPAAPVELVLDTLAIDADRLAATVLFRGSMVLEPGVEPETLRVFGGLQVAGSAIRWPPPKDVDPPPTSRRPAPDHAAEEQDFGSTRMLSAADAARAAEAEVHPFSQSSAPSLPMEPASTRKPPEPDVGEATIVQDLDALRRAALPFAQPAPPAPPPPAMPPPPPSVAWPAVAPSPPSSPGPAAPLSPPSAPGPETPDFSATVTMTMRAVEDASRPPALPFVAPRPGEAFLPEPPPQRPPHEPQPDFGATMTFTGPIEDLKRAVAPFPIAAPRPAVARAVELPKRESPQVPIVTRAPLSVAATPWQLAPPRDVLTLVVKATCDLVPGGAAKLRDEADPLSGDVNEGDDLGKSLRYASDFAVLKPRADVVLTGHAHAPRGSAQRARVAFRFGTGQAPRGFFRAVDVLGDRAWKRAGIALAPGDPASFEKIPLVYERAFGGAGHASNPVGTPLPNLETPDHAITSPNDAPPPACFAPIAPGWRERASKLGTFDAVLARRALALLPGRFRSRTISRPRRACSRSSGCAATSRSPSRARTPSTR